MVIHERFLSKHVGQGTEKFGNHWSWQKTILRTLTWITADRMPQLKRFFPAQLSQVVSEFLVITFDRN